MITAVGQLLQPPPGPVGRRRREPEPDVTGAEDQVRQPRIVEDPGQITGQQLLAEVDVQYVEIDDVAVLVPAPRPDRDHVTAFGSDHVS
jgi:hypothetical protein